MCSGQGQKVVKNLAGWRRTRTPNRPARRVLDRVDALPRGHHDRVLAIVSHLPHLIAFTICGTADDLADESRQEVVNFAASGFPRSLPGVPPKRNLHGISFAVANMTGFVARACEPAWRATFCRASTQQK